MFKVHEVNNFQQRVVYKHYSVGSVFIQLKKQSEEEIVCVYSVEAHKDIVHGQLMYITMYIHQNSRLGRRPKHLQDYLVFVP